MEKYKLTRNDYNNLEKLLNIAAKIGNIYKVLENLEINIKKESEEYKQALTSLQVLINMEEIIYRKIGSNPRKLAELLFYLYGYNQVNEIDFLTPSDEISKDDILKARIGIRLERLLSEAKFPELEDEVIEEMISRYDDELLDSECLFDIPDPEEVEKQYFYSEKLSNEVEKDLLNTILRILNEYIYNPNYQNIRQKLTRFKYHLSYLFRQIEIDFLEHNFEINSNLYWSAHTILDINKGDQEDFDLAKDSYAEDLLYSQSDNLTRLIFTNISDRENYASAIISQIIIRSCFLFANSKIRDDFSNYLLAEFNDAGLSNKELQDIIKDALNKIDEDREIPIILSIKLD